MLVCGVFFLILEALLAASLIGRCRIARPPALLLALLAFLLVLGSIAAPFTPIAPMHRLVAFAMLEAAASAVAFLLWGRIRPRDASSHVEGPGREAIVELEDAAARLGTFAAVLVVLAGFVGWGTREASELWEDGVQQVFDGVDDSFDAGPSR